MTGQGGRPPALPPVSFATAGCYKDPNPTEKHLVWTKQNSKYFGCVLNFLFTRNASVSTQKCKHSCLPGLLFIVIFHFKDKKHETTKSVKFERKFWHTDQTN